MHRAAPDHEFIEQIHLIAESLQPQLAASIAMGDEKKENYLRGVFRGVQMVREAYFICWQIEELSDIQMNSVQLISGAAPSVPPSSDQEDLP